MSHSATLSAFVDGHIDVSNALRELQLAGIDLNIISVVGKDAHTDGHSIGVYQTGNGPHYKGAMGAFWTGLWSLMPGSAFFVIPGVGQVLMAGPIVGYLVNGHGQVDGEQVPNVLCTALLQNNVQSAHIAQYETAVRAGRYIMLVHGTADEVSIARFIFERRKHDIQSAHVRDGITPPHSWHPEQHRLHVKVTSLFLVVLAMLGGTLAGCGDSAPQTEGPAQRAGEATDKAIDKTGEGIKEGVNKTGQAIEKTGDKIQDSTK